MYSGLVSSPGFLALFSGLSANVSWYCLPWMKGRWTGGSAERSFILVVAQVAVDVLLVALALVGLATFAVVFGFFGDAFLGGDFLGGEFLGDDFLGGDLLMALGLAAAFFGVVLRLALVVAVLALGLALVVAAMVEGAVC